MESFSVQTGENIAAAVSGGADSLCLALFLNRWIQGKNISLTALTVNHNLRPEAAREAGEVHAFLEKQRIKHFVLFNPEPVPKTNLESYAREIRYRLMTDFCRENNIFRLFLGHHLGDQSETFLLRLAKSSALKGLSGMRGQTMQNGIMLCRPLLSVSKSSLTAALQKQNIDWAEDSMNQNEQFERVKWRHFWPVLETAGIKASAVCETMRRLSRADKALDFYTASFISKNVWIDFRGFARLPVSLWKQTPGEVQIRVIQALIRRIGQTNAFISLKALESLCADLPGSRTLGGCCFKPHKTGLYIFREQRGMAGQMPLKAGYTVHWDRFTVTPFIDGFITAGPPLRKIENIPAAVQKTFPAVFMQKKLEKITQIDYKEKNDLFVKIEFKGKNGDNY